MLYFGICLKLVHDWYVLPDFSHGFIVVLFGAYLVWTKRASLLKEPSRPSWVGFALILPGLLLLVLGVLGAELYLARISGLFLLLGTAWIVLGTSAARQLIPICALLLLAIPIPQVVFFQLTFPLQHLAASLATLLLQLCGVPVLQEGNLIHLPSITLEVAEACSGIRSLFSLCTVAVLYGYFADKKMSHRVLLVLASIPVAVVANALRIFGTGLLVHYRGTEVALGFLHEFSGLLVFVFAVVALMAIHVLLRRMWCPQ
ncbi:MAG: exosortase/archaeosortase family protein [Terriglobus sp.]